MRAGLADTRLGPFVNLLSPPPGTILASREAAVSFDGDTWDRITGMGSRGGVRHMVPLASLVADVPYTFVCEVANPGSEPLDMTASWCDKGPVTRTVGPGARRTFRSTASREYSSIYRFGDMRPTNVNDGVFLYRLGTLVKGEYSGPPFDGNKPGARWLGTPNSSPSVGYPTLS